jgi:polyvinyl alcohol dehydrogenase (cytochrome)
MMPADVQRSAAAAILAAAVFTAALSPPAAASGQSPDQPAADSGTPRTLCADPPRAISLGSAQWNGWGRGAENTRYQPEPAIRATDVPKLGLKWAFGYAGTSGSAPPTIVDGRLFVASASGQVYSLDAKSGCIYWTFDAAAGVRTAVSVAELAAVRMPVAPSVAKQKRGKHKLTNAHLEMPRVPTAAFFGDERGTVYALDAVKGTLLWKTVLDSHPSARIVASPTLYKDRLYVAVGSGETEAAKEPTYACCTFRGSVASLDIASGRIVWKTLMVTDEPKPVRTESGTQQFGPAGIPIVGPATVDGVRGLVYVATGDSFNPKLQPLADAVVALDLESGAVRWSKQPDGESEFSSPVVLRSMVNGRQPLVAGQRSGSVYGLDPDRAGEVLWQLPPPDAKAAGAVGWGAAADHRSVYVPLGGETDGSLLAVDIKTGVKRWQTETPGIACSWPGDCSHAQAQAVTVIPGIVFSGSLDGHLRAYSANDGRILWDYDTAKDFVTVNHVKAAGGSLDRGGPTIVNGVIFLNSGGGRGQPGNVLLALSVDGK